MTVEEFIEALKKYNPDLVENDSYTFSPEQKEWIQALESADYPQTRGGLVDYYGFCCLGVACEIATKAIPEFIQEKIPEFIQEKNRVAYGYRYKNEDNIYTVGLPKTIADRLKLVGCSGNFNSTVLIRGRTYMSLAALNDCGVPFTHIAAFIKKFPEMIFHE